MRWCRPARLASSSLALFSCALSAYAAEAPFGAVSLGELRASRAAGVPAFEGAPVRGASLPKSELAAKAYPFARLSSKVYAGAGDESCPALERRRDEASGFDALACRDRESGRVVVVFRGTDELKDWVKTDILQPLVLPRQYKLGLEFAAEMKERYGDVAVTGHSLGGGIAQFAGSSLGLETWTFNPAGLGLDALRRLLSSSDSSRVTNLIVTGEPLATARYLVGPDFVRLRGETVHLMPAGGGVSGHGMSSVLAALERAAVKGD